VCGQLDLCAIAGRWQAGVLERSAAEVQARGMDLEQGPVLRGLLMETGGGQAQRLFLSIHHLAVDGVSWRILLEDLQQAWAAVEGGVAVQLPPRSTPSTEWARELVRAAEAGEADREWDYWRNVCRDSRALPLDYPQGCNLEAAAASVRVSLSAPQTTQLLQRVPEAYGTGIQEVLLTALGEALHAWAGGDLLVAVEGHGRHDLFAGREVSRTVGWFTTVYPLRLGGESADAGQRLRRMKEQLRQIPRHGMGYGWLRYLSARAEQRQDVADWGEPAVVFNYLGQLDSVLGTQGWLGAAAEGSGAVRSLRAERPYLIEINGGVAGGCLQMHWSYSAELHERSTVERVAGRFITTLEGLIEHCLALENPVYTPSDFPDAGLSQKELDKLVSGTKQIDDIYPLSPAQHGMLFHSIYDSAAGTYIEQLVCEFEGTLDSDALEAAWEKASESHSVLRTSFVVDSPDRPLQVVQRRAVMPFDELWMTESDPIGQQSYLRQFLQKDRERGFVLAKAPLSRVTVIHTGANHHWLIWTYHHVLLDGWSTALVLNDVFQAYEARRSGQELAAKSRRPFRDYIACLNRRSRLDEQMFWSDYLNGFEAPEFSLLDGQSLIESASIRDTRRSEISLSQDLTSALRSMGRQHRLTMNTVIASAWALLLGRYTGTFDVTFGTVSSGRPVDLQGVEEMTGLFINTVPVRVLIPVNLPLLSWLVEQQEQQSRLRDFEHSSFSEIVSWAGIPQGRQLLETVFVFENYPIGDTVVEQGAAAGITNVQSVERTNFPITFAAHPGSQLRLDILYDAHRFAAAYIDGMLAQVQHLLMQMVTEPEQVLSAFSLASEEQEDELRRTLTAAL
jgi:non-ribosomal peptide synthase protein (TIGR01720 family)